MPYLASMIAAISFAVLVAIMAVPLLKLGKVFDQLRTEIERTSSEAIGTISEGTQSLKEINQQLDKIDTVTTSIAQVSQDVSAVSTLVSATVGGPLIKIAAFSNATKKVFTTGKEDRAKAKAAKQASAQNAAGTNTASAGKESVNIDEVIAESGKKAQVK